MIKLVSADMAGEKQNPMAPVRYFLGAFSMFLYSEES